MKHPDHKIFYTGVGSRQTPDTVLDLMYRIAKLLAKKNWILRSGGALGADKAFENGCDSINGGKEIYFAKDCNEEAEKIARRFHPKWYLCSDYAKKLHGRNSFQVLGKELTTPSHVLICWTKDGCLNHKMRTKVTGGTGTAISISDYLNVRVINLKNDKHFEKMVKFVKGEEKMSNHTPDPWTRAHDLATRIYAKGKLVANTSATGHETTKEDIANARLIQQAPKMLKALEQVQRVMNLSNVVTDPEDDTAVIQFYKESNKMDEMVEEVLKEIKGE